MSLYDNDSDPLSYRLLRRSDGEVVTVCWQDGIDFEDEYDGAFVGPRYSTREDAQAAIEQVSKKTVYPDPKEEVEGELCWRLLRRPDGEVLTVCWQDGTDFEDEYAGTFIGDRYNTKEEAERAISRPRVIPAYPEPGDIDKYSY
jgi:hypothetical protein